MTYWDAYHHSRRMMREEMTEAQFATVEERRPPLVADGMGWQPVGDGRYRLTQRGRQFILAEDGTLTPEADVHVGPEAAPSSPSRSLPEAE